MAFRGPPSMNFARCLWSRTNSLDPTDRRRGITRAGMRVIEAEMPMRPWNVSVPEILDLVFADIELPGSMNGLELARRLQTDLPDIKLLITSGRLPEPEATSAGAFIAKPYDIAEVVGRIRATLNESSSRMSAASLRLAARPRFSSSKRTSLFGNRSRNICGVRI